MKHLPRLLFFLLMAVVFSNSLHCQTNQNEDLQRYYQQVEEEFKQILDCDRLIKGLDQQLKELSNEDMSIYLTLRDEIEKAKRDILKHCVNGTYQPPQEPEIADTPEPETSTNPTMQKLMDKLSNLEKGSANTETYGERYYSFTRIPKSISFYIESTVTKEKFSQWMFEKYGVQLNLLYQDPNLMKYQQTLDNIPLLGCMYSVMLRKNGTIQKAFGLLYNAKRANPGMVASYSTIYQKISPKFKDITPSKDSTKLYVQKNRSHTDSNFYLCYAFYDDRKVYYFDAVNAQLIHSEPYVINCSHHEADEDRQVELFSQVTSDNEVPKHKNPELVQTFYYGTQRLETFQVSEQLFMLRSNTKDDKNAVILYDSLTIKGGGNTPVCIDNKWTMDQIREKGMLDAYIGGIKTMEYFRKKFGRQSFDNAASPLHIYFKPFNRNGDINRNAEWMEKYNVMAYGISDGKPYASVDVIAHEFTHGVVIHHVPGAYHFGEQGTIYEAVSDILASAVEHSAGLPGSNHWKILEQQSSKSVRDLSNPNPSIYAKNYEGKNWIDEATCLNDSVQKDQCGVHINSTVISHWYYLLVHGGKGENEHKKKFDVSGTFTIDEAAELVYESILFMVPNMNVKDYAEMVIDMAERKYGKEDQKTCTVKNAWYAVGVLVDAPEKCVPGWTFTLADDPLGKAVFYGKGDSIVISGLDRDTGFRTKIYRHKQSAYWKIVAETDDGIERMTFPIDFMQQLGSYETAKNLNDFQHEYMEESIRQMRERLKDPNLTPQERAEANYMLRNAEQMYATSKSMSKQALEELKVYEEEMSQTPMLISSEEFWGSNKAIREFDKQFLVSSKLYEGLEANNYIMPGGISWTSTTRIPYGIGDLAFPALHGTKGNLKLGADHFLRGFPLIINDQKVIFNIKEYVPNNFDSIFSDAAVF
jgi:Zn-dependent metalloprotease